MPETYAPPEQRQPFENFRPYRSNRLISMSDADAEAHIVKDILHDRSQPWSWTRQRPTVRLPGGSNQNLVYLIDFTLPEVTFKDTGTVTLSFYVNDYLLDRVRYTTSGNKHFEKPVPAEWAPDYTEATAAAEIDKLWFGKNDNLGLGFILTSIGLKQAD
ncbi:MAG TPA: hypothetical protein VH639_30335 [Bryobacteraceae bacterium]|jgi:hypothetical protein